MAIQAQPERRPAIIAGRRRLHPGRGVLVLPPVAYLILGMLVPIALIALYSVNLQTNLPGAKAEFTLIEWRSFLPGWDTLKPDPGVIWERFKSAKYVAVPATIIAYAGVVAIVLRIRESGLTFRRAISAVALLLVPAAVGLLLGEYAGASVFWNRFTISMQISLVVSIAAVLAAYPLAYYLAFIAHRRRYTLLLLILAPFFTSYLLRVIAWQIMLNTQGVINSGLEQLGIISDPIVWIWHTKFSIGLVLFYSYVPFVALPIFVVLENMDRRYLEAAQDLGASRFVTFLRVTLPLSLPGVIAAFVFVLIPTTGEFVAPLLVGGEDDFMLGNFIQSFFVYTPIWGRGAVLAMWLMIVVLVLIVIFARWLTVDVREAETK